MALYSYHIYGKTSQDLQKDIDYLIKSIDKDSLYPNQIPVIIAEYNTHTSADWNKLNSTADDDYEASRLAIEIANVLRLTSSFVFKFSITSSFSKERSIAKNGLHYGDNSVAPFHISDSTLSAESVRLLSIFTQKKIYFINTKDSNKYRAYLATESNKSFNLIAINDRNESVQLLISLTEWKKVNQTRIFIESVSKNYRGEISTIITKDSDLFSFRLDSFTTIKLMFQSGLQRLHEIKALIGCYSQAGTRMSQINCLKSIIIGTSNTALHEETSIGLLKFNLNDLKQF